MTTPKVYVIGKVSRLPEEEVRLKFSQSSQALRNAGFIAINPIEVVNDFTASWKKAMQLCIPEVIKCDAVYVQEDAFHHSEGSEIEIALCEGLNIPLFTDITTLQKHFQKLPVEQCDHIDTYVKVINTACGCVTTVQVCRWCGTELSAPQTEC